MRRRRVIGIGIALVAAAGALVLAGCSRPAAIASFWPVAVSERTTARPPELVRWPLTGERAPSEAATRVRVVVVKVENSPPARPQTGLNDADIVYETITEGGISRFAALFQSKSPKVVGPVRSARLSDAYIVPQWGALLAHVGENSTVDAQLKAAGVQDMDQFVNPGPYWRSSDRSAPHNMYVSVPKLRAAAIERRKLPATQSVKPLPFRPLLAADATPTIREIKVPLSDVNVVTWRWDPSADRYYRFINGKPSMDRSGGQHSARNVVTMYARYTATAKRDKVGSPTYSIDLAGSDRVSVFRDGGKFDGRWSAGTSTPPTFTSAQGAPIRFAPGNTWIEVVPTDVNVFLK
jgi:hypothetical protein